MQVATFIKKYLKIHYLLGTVLFLEEDHFVAEDFIHVLKLMEKEQEGEAKEVKNSNLEIRTVMYLRPRDSSISLTYEKSRKIEKLFFVRFHFFAVYFNLT